jgi:hypothetical protein
VANQKLLQKKQAAGTKLWETVLTAESQALASLSAAANTTEAQQLLASLANMPAASSRSANKHHNEEREGNFKESKVQGEVNSIRRYANIDLLDLEAVIESRFQDCDPSLRQIDFGIYNDVMEENEDDIMGDQSLK